MGTTRARRCALAVLPCFFHRALASCNLTRYDAWYDADFFEQTELTNYMIKVDKQAGFWGVTEFLRYTPAPTNGQVMEKAAEVCARSLLVLKRDLAGRHGDVTDWSIWGPMRGSRAPRSDERRTGGRVSDAPRRVPPSTPRAQRSTQRKRANAPRRRCADECLDSDILHLEAMMQSGCDCLELSPRAPRAGEETRASRRSTRLDRARPAGEPRARGRLGRRPGRARGGPAPPGGAATARARRRQPGDAQFTRAGQFCARNSGRLLCETLDRCGVWDCRLGDFMCPRHEFNKEWTRFRGFGDCSAAPRRAGLAGLAALAAALAAARLA